MTGVFIIPILLLWNLRLRVAKQLAQGRTANHGTCNMVSVSQAPQLMVFTAVLCRACYMDEGINECTT